MSKTINDLLNLDAKLTLQVFKSIHKERGYIASLQPISTSEQILIYDRKGVSSSDLKLFKEMLNSPDALITTGGTVDESIANLEKKINDGVQRKTSGS